MQLRRQWRDVHGVIILDKPIGISSTRALQTVRRLFQARKAGHGGSLDPLATGQLPICFGRATRATTFLLGAAKSYRTTCRLGVTTATGDAEGEVLRELPVPVLTHGQIKAALGRLTGPTKQIPPMYSALKHKGQRLYELARAGIEVERPAREVTIYSLDLIEKTADTLTLDVHCSKGTYVRTLIEDLGLDLGCGAHVTALKRTVVEPFQAGDEHTLSTLERAAGGGQKLLDSLIKPTDSALAHLPGIRVEADAAAALCHGQTVDGFEQPGTVELVRLYGPDEIFLGIAEFTQPGTLKMRSMLGNPEDIQLVTKRKS